jgi:site-specific DNA-methyltransferase (adenine-specific)
MIHHGDCLDILPTIGAGTVDLTVTSPPYDNLRTYNGTLNDWTAEKWQAVIRELFRVTKDGGVVVWVVGDATVNGSETGTSFRQALYAMECGFSLYDTMIYEKAGTGATGNNRAYLGVYEFMFVLTKGRPKTVNLLYDRKNAEWDKTGKYATRPTRRDADGVPSDRKRKPSEPLGRRFNIWRFSGAEVRWEKTRGGFDHPAMFPHSLARDHILSWSNPGDVVLDPFLGSGTTAKMALLTGRRFIGIERDAEYLKIAETRVASAISDLEAQAPDLFEDQAWVAA